MELLELVKTKLPLHFQVAIYLASMYFINTVMLVLFIW